MKIITKKRDDYSQLIEGGGGEVKALLVLRHEAGNVLERAVAFLFFQWHITGLCMISLRVSATKLANTNRIENLRGFS